MCDLADRPSAEASATHPQRRYCSAGSDLIVLELGGDQLEWHWTVSSKCVDIEYGGLDILEIMYINLEEKGLAARFECCIQQYGMHNWTNGYSSYEVHRNYNTLEVSNRIAAKSSGRPQFHRRIGRKLYGVGRTRFQVHIWNQARWAG
jgi:hypothetical protein